MSLTNSELGETTAKLLGDQTQFSQLHLLPTTFLAEDSVFQPAVALYTTRSCSQKPAFEYAIMQTNCRYNSGYPIVRFM